MALEAHKAAILKALAEGHARRKKPGGFRAPSVNDKAAWADITRAVKLWSAQETHAAGNGPRPRARGRPPGSPLQRLIEATSGVFFQRTGSEPGFTRVPIERLFEDDTSSPATGPFIDFIQEIAASQGVRSTPDGVADALRKVRAPFAVKGQRVRRNQDWFTDLLQPVPVKQSSASVFAKAMNKLRADHSSGGS